MPPLQSVSQKSEHIVVSVVCNEICSSMVSYTYHDASTQSIIRNHSFEKCKTVPEIESGYLSSNSACTGEIPGVRQPVLMSPAAPRQSITKYKVSSQLFPLLGFVLMSKFGC